MGGPATLCYTSKMATDAMLNFRKKNANSFGVNGHMLTELGVGGIVEASMP